jgi:hypothetical protein
MVWYIATYENTGGGYKKKLIITRIYTMPLWLRIVLYFRMITIRLMNLDMFTQQTNIKLVS